MITKEQRDFWGAVEKAAMRDYRRFIDHCVERVERGLDVDYGRLIALRLAVEQLEKWRYEGEMP